MTEPRRWLDDPDADPLLREVLGQASGARRLDAVTRGRLKGRIAARAALPVAAAGWIFVKSAAAALGVVVGTATVGVVTGVLELERPAPGSAPEKPVVARPVSKAASPSRPAPATPQPAEAAEPELNPAPSLPVVSPSAAGPTSSATSLAAEAALLEQARGGLRRDPGAALQLCEQHARRFPAGQLSAERTLIQIDALHRLARHAEARALARRLLSGAGAELYAERVRQLLGENLQP